ncbi:MAG: endonuclease [Candidatus Izemoplasmatales bacterium]|jgi:endonuclease I/beta-lactamase superfamily II metal-dependent hydrolase
MVKKGVFIFLCLLGMTSMLVFQPQELHAESTVTVNVISYFSDDNQIATEVIKAYGSKVSFYGDLEEDTDFVFAYWIYNGVVRKDLPSNTLFTVTSDTEIIGIFRPVDKWAAVFMDSNGELIDVQYITSGADATDVTTGLPTKPGYEVATIKWDNSLINIQTNMVYVLQYTQTATTPYTVSVINGTGDGTYTYSNYATVTADVAEAGLYFNYWKIGSRIVSTSSTYVFSVFGDVTIEAVYSSEQIIDVPMITISNDLAIRSGYQSFVGQFSIPTGFEFVEYGIITSQVAGVIDLNSASITRYQGSIYNIVTNEFLFSTEITTIAAKRAYLVVADSFGNFMTVYDETIADTPDYTYADDLFFSYYIEGSSYNKALAIFNGTGADIDLTGYYIKLYANGTTTATSTLNMSGTIGHGEVYVIAYGSANATILAMADVTSAVCNFNGDDAIELLNGANVIDSIGQKGVDPGTAWSVSGVSTLDQSLTRNANVTSGRSESTAAFNPSLEWISHVQDYTTGLDTHTMTNMGPEGGSGVVATSIQAFIPNLVFMIDDTINYSNAFIKVFYNDGSAIAMALTADMVSGFASTTAGSFTMTITYGANTDTLAYTVTAEPATGTLVIYEVYGGGGNTGATYTNDYVVLYNGTNTDINLSTYSVQYASATGTTYTVIALTGSITSENYYLISLGSGGTNGSALPVVANVSATTNIAATAGKMALVTNQTAITGKTTETVIDFLGYGSTADEYETAPTATLSATLSAKRNSSTDTDANVDDFTVGTPDLSYVEASITLVSISANNIDAYYEVNDPLNISGATLTLYYSNGSTGSTTLESSMVSGFSSTTLGDYSLTITYQGLTDDYAYHVIDYSALTNAEVHFVDIGATGGGPGEAILIQIGGIDILIDSGEQSTATQTALLAFLAANVTDGTIEYIIATHQDADHIGNFVAVLNAYVVNNAILYSTDVSIATGLRTTFETAVANEGCTVYYGYDLATATDPTLTIATGIILEFYNTGYLTTDDANASSLVFVLEAFNTRMLFTGDAEGNQEANYGPLVGDVDIFKLGHHGALAGTTAALLTAITPEVAIVTNGDYLGNYYEHPKYESLARIYAYSNIVPIYAVTGGNGSGSDISLQRNGTITIEITGSGYTITSENYGLNPMEISNTDYWNDVANTTGSTGYYYALATGITDGELLKTALSNIIDGHTVLSYDDVTNALKTTDADPNNAGNIILFYTGRSQDANTFVGSTGNQDYWNREHIWAQAHGIDGALPAYTDLHHLRPTDVSVNADRGNLDFGDATTLVADTYGEDVLSYCYISSSYFEPRDEIKGDVARMMFYMATRYEGNNGEPDLELINGLTDTDSALFGDLATLLLWNELDPVDDAERARNELVYSYQGNRNPFIDHPELVDLIFGNSEG